jgi:hypothetical protein
MDRKLLLTDSFAPFSHFETGMKISAKSVVSGDGISKADNYLYLKSNYYILLYNIVLR